MAMTVQAAQAVIMQAAGTEHEVNGALSYGVGIGILLLLLALMGALVAFGGGREHS